MWPLDNIQPPDLLLPGIAMGALLLSVAPIAWSTHGIRRGHTNTVKFGVVIALLLGVVALALFSYDLSLVNFSWRTNAYGSVFYFTVWFMDALLIVGLLMALFTLFWAWQGHYDARNHQAVTNTALFWYFIVASGAAVFVTLYVSPYLG